MQQLESKYLLSALRSLAGHVTFELRFKSTIVVQNADTAHIAQRSLPGAFEGTSQFHKLQAIYSHRLHCSGLDQVSMFLSDLTRGTKTTAHPERNNETSCESSGMVAMLHVPLDSGVALDGAKG